MFTTITKLRASHAQQDRVTKVENALKKKFGGVWYSDAAFPMVFIVISNGMDDYRWVELAEGVHHIPKGWTLKASNSLNRVLPPTWGDSLNKVNAATYLEMFGRHVRAASADVPFYPREATTAQPLTASMMAPAELAAAQKNQQAINNVITKLTTDSRVKSKKPAASKARVKLTADTDLTPWPFPKSPTEVKATSIDHTKEPTGKVVSKPLPLPSVLKQIRLLVKGHPKMKMEELKGQGQLVISW